MYGYIYITENLINHKKYIGQHKSDVFDESYKGSGKLLRRAFEKYGWENFKTEVIECCESREELNEKEVYWISYHNAVKSDDFYNILIGGYGDDFGRNSAFKGKKHTEETKQRMSKARLGTKRPHKGVPRSEECRRKSSESHKGIKRSVESRKRQSEATKGIQRRRKMIMCIETGVVYNSANDASIAYKGNEDSKGSIRRSASNYEKGISSRSCGVHWRWKVE